MILPVTRKFSGLKGSGLPREDSKNHDPKEDLIITEDPKEDPIIEDSIENLNTEDPKEDHITEDSGGDPIINNPKLNLLN